MSPPLSGTGWLRVDHMLLAPVALMGTASEGMGWGAAGLERGISSRVPLTRGLYPSLQSEQLSGVQVRGREG